MRRLALVCVIVSLSASACGKSSSNQGLARLNKTGFISAAAARSLEAGTAKLAMSMHVKGATSAESFQATADGAMDFTNKLLEMTTTAPAISGVKGTMRVIVTPNGQYALGPNDMTTELGGMPGKWMFISKANLDSGPDPTGLSNFTDPSSLFDVLKSFSSSVSVAGRESIRGVPTTAYLVILDEDKMLARATAAERSAFASMPIPQMKVYVGDDSLIRREALSFSEQGATFEMTLDLYDYGAPVHITVPKAADVVEIRDLPTPAET